ncbi:hypothetical protein DQQ10_26905 [Pseudochryseolinea flava]|uniref:Colicin immunity protein / pyocin immunity protein n=2 Tax=Pseudochryseolinea flava TaxID=2059302 RepID=A0A364XTY9_9BACT|nr:hypothetical protein DQQ10_26905 [Pseudochryseolinea flava]
MTREKLIDLVIEIISVEGKTLEQIDRLIEVFEKNVPHPSPTDLIYHEDLTPEEIVDKALRYKPIQL